MRSADWLDRSDVRSISQAADMLRPFCRATPLCLLLVCLPTLTLPLAGELPPDPPVTLQGFLRYKVRGLSAVQGGFLSGSIMSVATMTGMQSAAMNMLKLIGGAAKLSGNPATSEIFDFLRTGKGFDFSGAPVSAGYDIELDFLLQSDGKGNFHLKTGHGRYSSNTDADLALNSPDGNNHHFTDRFRGQGSATLTRDNAVIELTRSGKGKDARLTLSVDTNFPIDLVGKTTWSAMGGLSVISREDKPDQAVWHATILGQNYSEAERQSQFSAGVSYSRTGSPDSVLRGRETWQDLNDSGVLVEWEIWDECSAAIESPKENDELVFDNSTPGQILRPAKADVQPSFWDEDLHWSFHEIQGSDLEPRPNKSNGNDFDFTYTKLPEKNSSFAFWEVAASFDTPRAKKAGCKDPKPRTVGYFYPRDGTNHGGTSDPVDPEAKLKGPTPNWFHYWQQTKAVQGQASNTRYGAGSPTCNIERVGGYYRDGTSHVVICDLGAAWHHHLSHPLVDLELDGIDNYAAVVRHEWTHYEDYMRWWHGKGAQADTEVCEQKQGEIVTKSIGDKIPDAVESKVRIPSPLNGEYEFFDGTVCDTPGLGFTDEHYIAWMAMVDWKLGSADSEDWACPGHQTFEKCPGGQ